MVNWSIWLVLNIKILVYFGSNFFFIFPAMFLYTLSGLGITAGAHRLWAHRSYKARFPLRVMLALFNTLAFQDCAMHWARDHRVHHKYSETDADPHNATRLDFYYFFIMNYLFSVESGKFFIYNNVN